MEVFCFELITYTQILIDGYADYYSLILTCVTWDFLYVLIKKSK